MATATRAIRAVTPHVPKIKFPQRTTKADLSVKNVAPVESPVQPTNIKSRGSASSLDVLPRRYQRQQISPEEIEYIERGGPV